MTRSPFGSLLTDEDILRVLQQILHLLVVCIENELDLLEMQNDTFVAQDDVLGRSGPEQTSVPSAMRSAGGQRCS